MQRSKIFQNRSFGLNSIGIYLVIVGLFVGNSGAMAWDCHVKCYRVSDPIHYWTNHWTDIGSQAECEDYPLINIYCKKACKYPGEAIAHEILHSQEEPCENVNEVDCPL